MQQLQGSERSTSHHFMSIVSPSLTQAAAQEPLPSGLILPLNGGLL